jgi:hypothetical protein
MPVQSHPSVGGSAFTPRSRRSRRIALHCESLETRQLLSIGQTGLAAGVLVNPAAASAQISVPAIVSNYNAPSYATIEIEFGSFGGLNQIQIAFLGTAPVFSPIPTSSSGGSGSGLGSLSGTSGNAQSGFGLTSTPTTGSAITPLNPTLTSSTTTSAITPGVPVYLVPPPLAPLAVHLGPSASPTTAITDSTLISNLDEHPMMTHFGQADTFEGRRLFLERLYFQPKSSSLLDDVEPFGPPTPIEVPAAQPPAPRNGQPQAPDAAPIRPMPPISDPNIDDALDLTDARVFTRSHDGEAAQADDQFSSTNTSWSFSAVFGAAVVATGGYHLAMREADRFRGRWIPRWVGAERPTKRKGGAPAR